MTHARLVVTWNAGDTDPRPVTITTSWLPRLFRADGLTVGRTIRVRSAAVVLNLTLHAPFVRHELTHVRQQHDYGVVRWLWRYITSRRFRAAAEREARNYEQVARQEAGLPCWPQWRIG